MMRVVEVSAKTAEIKVTRVRSDWEAGRGDQELEA